MSKEKLSVTTDKAGKLFDKTKKTLTKAIDQNGDGKFNKEDVSQITTAIKESAAETSRRIELKTLRPIFADTLDNTDFIMPKFIRVADRDKKRSESEVCQGSIGYLTDSKGMNIVNVFRDSIDSFGLSFYPDNTYEFYYVDPSDRDKYIAMDDYFNYLRTERISELQRIAHSLGAKHFRVTYKEEQSSFSSRAIKAKVKVASLASVDTEHKSEQTKYSTVEIAAQMDCVGHEPQKPVLKYLQRDTNIKTLIEMRMSDKPLTHQIFMLKLSNSSGIKESDAIKIDAVLKGMKLSGNTTVASEAKNEARRYLEYEIDF